MPPPQVIFVYDPPTKVKSRRYTLKPNSEIMFPGGQVPKHRRQFILTNPGALAPDLGSNNIQIRSERTGVGVAAGAELDGGYAALVFAQQAVTIFTNDDLFVRNPSDSATVSVIVCEIFYA